MTGPGDVGGYRIEGVLGPDPAGLVHAATGPRGQRAAVAVVAPELAADPDVRARFRARIEAARRLRGPWMVPVLDAGPDAPRPWLATAVVPGPSLEQAVRTTGPLPPAVVSAIGRTLAAALVDAHRRGVTHGDLQPSRILLGPDGPWLSGPVPGAPSVFTSPEQATGEPHGPASDVFSLAAVLVFAASGRGPFGDGDPLVVARRIADDDPRLDGVPQPLRDTAWLCLDRSAAGRPTMEELIARLPGPDPGPGWLPPAVAPPLPPPASPPPAGPGGRPTSRRSLLVAAGAAGTSLLIGGGVYGLVRGLRPGSDAPADAPLPPPATAANGTAEAQAIWIGSAPEASRAVRIAGNLVLIGGSGTVVALDTDGGGMRWSWVATPAPGADTGFNPDGVVLAVADGIIAVATQGVVAALDPATGQPRWTYTPPPVTSYQALAGVDAGAGAGLVYAAAGNRIQALDAATGQPRWTYTVPGEFAGGPTVGGPHCLIPAGAGVDAVDPATGRLQWRHTTGQENSSKLTIAGPLAYLSINQIGVRALDLLTGAVRWDAAVDRADAEPPAVAGGRVLVTAMDQQVHALQVTDGKPVWNGPDPSTGGRAKIVTGGGARAYAGDEGGRIYGLDTATGAVRWTAEPTKSSQSIYGIAATDTLVVATAFDGTVRAYAA